jgi:hypothetical protein
VIGIVCGGYEKGEVEGIAGVAEAVEAAEVAVDKDVGAGGICNVVGVKDAGGGGKAVGRAGVAAWEVSCGWNEGG